MKTDSGNDICATKIIGGVGSGKTEALIKGVVTLLKQGEIPGDICCICASPQAVSAFAKRLEEVASVDVKDVTIITPQEESLALLSGDPTRAGEPPHLLTAFEEKFLFEDMKTTGLQLRRLREMLKFLSRGLTEISDKDDDWLTFQEEKNLFEYLQQVTSFMGGITKEALSNNAVTMICACNADAVQVKYRHVFVDDYQCLNRASQQLACELALCSITIAADPQACLEICDPYPYGEGLDEYDERYPACTHIMLNDTYLPVSIEVASSSLLDEVSQHNAITRRPSKSEQLGVITSFEFATASQEFEGVAKLVQERIAKNDGIRPCDVFIVSPHNIWTANISKALKRAGLDSAILSDRQILNGDVCVNDRCVSLRMFTALNLVANPKDCVAWRCWCGFGDHLTNSLFFKDLRLFAAERAINLVDALDLCSQADGMGFKGSEKPLLAYRAGQKMLQEANGLCGSALLRIIAGQITGEKDSELSPVMKSLLLGFDESETAQELYAQAERNLRAPTFSFDKDVIHIGTTKNLNGLRPKVVILTGFVNGFIPNKSYFDNISTTFEKQVKMHDRDARLLCNLVGKTNSELYISYCTHADIDDAMKWNLKIDRVRLEEGKRVCLIGPSDFLPAICTEKTNYESVSACGELLGR